MDFDEIEKELKDNVMSSMKQNHNLLEENIKLKKKQEDDNTKFDKLLSAIDDKMTQMVDALNEIKNKESVINTTVVQNGSKTEVKREEKDIPRMFIPTPDIKGMKTSVSDIKKKIRKSNLGSAVDKLTELQDK